MRLSLSLLAKQFVMSSNDGCPYCGWSEEYPECHVHLAPFCPTVRAEYQVWVDDDGELCSRKRDFLWMLPRLLSWSRRAVARVEAEYAPHGPRGRLIIDEWGSLFS